MPAPLDLTGLRFGKLSPIGRKRVGNRTLWLCRCDCGGTEVVRSDHLTRKSRPATTACAACRRLPCIICGRLFSRVGSGSTCGATDCIGALKRINDALYAARHGPSLAAAARARYQATKSDPDKHRAALDRQNARRRRNRDLAADREYYWKNRAAIRRRLTARVEAMTPAERDDYLASRRALVARSKARAKLAEFIEIGRMLEDRLK